ncbi:TFIIS N-terminal domain-containing protein [Chloropicon roscoffensis]|uniref:TFIIS N-terminal domain-containing protein n=1 Tax=Chloropicon roscoffensis TaxID=1461544 RepID=A0A7S3CFD0_9CHLO
MADPKEFNSLFDSSDSEPEEDQEPLASLAPSSQEKETTSTEAEEKTTSKALEQEEELGRENKDEDFKAMFADSSDEEEMEVAEVAMAGKTTTTREKKRLGKAKQQKKKQKEQKGRLTARQVKAQRATKEGAVKEKGGASAADLFADSEDDEEGEATAADQAFIEQDDLFASSGDEGEGDRDVSALPQAEEAEEEDADLKEIDHKIKNRGKKKRKDLDPQEKAHICRSILARMEAAYDADKEAWKQQKPAVHKLKLLKEVEAVLIQRHMRETLLYESALSTMATWLEPLDDMTLPNVKIRTSLLRLLSKMNVRASDDTLELLQKSKIARIVMFYSKISDETPENKRLAGSMCQKWSNDILSRDRPIRPDNRLSEDIERNRISAKKGKKRSRLESRRPKLKVGSRGDKAKGEEDEVTRTRRPEAEDLDFKVQPASRVSASGDGLQEREKASDRRFKERFANRAPQKGFVKTTKMSIEGRGM